MYSIEVANSIPQVNQGCFLHYLGFLLFQKHLYNSFSTLLSLEPQCKHLSLSPGCFPRHSSAETTLALTVLFHPNETECGSRARSWQLLSVFAHQRTNMALLCVDGRSWRNSQACPLMGGWLLAMGTTDLLCASVTAERQEWLVIA